MATVAAGVDFLAQPVGTRWKLSFWSEQRSAMEDAGTFRTFGELREHVDVEAPKYARFNRQAKAHSRAINQPDVGEQLRDELMAEAEGCGENGDIECAEQTLARARRELKKDPGLLGDVENVISTYFPELLERRIMRNSNRVAARPSMGTSERLPKAVHASRSSNPIATLDRLPKAQRMWEAVYKSAQDRGFSEERSAQQAWGAVKQAGYRQDAQGRWHAPRQANPSQASARVDSAALNEIQGPLRVVSRRDGLWVIGQGVAIPVESKNEAKIVQGGLSGRAANPAEITEVRFESKEDLAEGLQLMDVALRPSRHERPLVFQVDWSNKALLLEGQPDAPGVDAALSALDYAKIPFDASVMPYAANPGSPGEAAGYAFVGTLAGSLLGFGMGALIGALIGASVGGAGGALIGGVGMGALGSYAGGIGGAVTAAQRGAPKGREQDAKWGAGLGAAVPYVGLFVAPAGAYFATRN